MLTEFHGVKQEPGARRRWFEGDGLELVVWHGTDDGLAGFQLCYTAGDGERALTWRPGVGFTHSEVDQGDNIEGGGKQSPILVPDGAVPWAELAAKFAAEGARLEPGLRELVAARLAARG